jgi:hypothetical protein
MLEEAGGREGDLAEGGLALDEVGPSGVKGGRTDGRGQVGDEVRLDGRLGLAEPLGDYELVRGYAGFGRAKDGRGDVGVLGFVEVGGEETLGQREGVTEEDAEEVTFRV